MNKIRQIDIDDLTKKGITICKLYNCYMLDLNDKITYDVSSLRVSNILEKIEDNSENIVFFEIVEEEV